jgi:DNA-binding PadR family transcriptional regulator
MPRRRRPSSQARRVLLALASDPTRPRYGYQLCEELQLSSGTLYPILMRLAERGLLEASWEAHKPGRPPRHLYRLSADGIRAAQDLASEERAARAPGRALARTS